MKSYNYICTECGTIVEHISEHMADEKPKKKRCPECDKMTCIYDWNELKSSAIHIPDHMKATGRGKTHYNKMPREHKKWKNV